jgi:hypothetical protein
MPEPIVSIDRIEAEARKAAAQYDDINDACPYSFYTEAGRVFRRVFQAERLKSFNTTKGESK